MSKRVVVVIACLAFCEIAARAGEERPAAPGASAAELVKKVRLDEAWIHRVKSFRVVFDDRWTKLPDAVERRRAELRAQFPQAQLDAKRFRDLLPDRAGTFQIAFDDKRLHHWSRDESREEMSFWDGTVYASLTADLLTGRTNYGYAPEPRGGTLLSSMSWLRGDYHRFWWSEPVNYDAFATSFGAPEQWVVTGRQDFHGADCHVLVRRHVNSGRMYVGVADGRLHGHSVGLVIAPSKSEAIAADVAKAFGGTATTSKEFTEWAGRLEKAKQDEVYAEFSFRRFAAGFGFIEHWLLDYAEVAPGCWFPMTQGYFVYHTPRNNATAADAAYDPESGKAPPLDARRDMKAVRVELDKPLPDALFTLGDLKEGAEVFDTTRKPFLSYKYKKVMTPEEWQAIQDQAVQRDDTFAKMKKAQDAVIGKPAPAFAQAGKWMNTQGPMTWDSFKGKVVVVDLFAHWCGPCRNDYPTLVQVAGQKDPNLVVLGIHVAHGADEAAKIRQLLKDFKIAYPVYLDVEGGPDEMGKLAGELGARALPHTFTVGPDGKVVAHGTLGEALEAAYRLTRDLKK